jgi:hypothetical protein
MSPRPAVALRPGGGSASGRIDAASMICAVVLAEFRRASSHYLLLTSVGREPPKLASLQGDAVAAIDGRDQLRAPSPVGKRSQSVRLCQVTRARARIPGGWIAAG